MPIDFTVRPEGRSGLELRLARANHDLNASGPSARLASLLPQHVQALTVDAEGRPISARLPYSLAAWLVVGMLTLEPAVVPLAVFMYIIGAERMGIALDAALSKHASDDEVSTSVLRLLLTRHAAGLRGTNPEHFMVTATDLIVVGGDADDAQMSSVATPRALPPLDPPWFAHVTFGNLLGLDGTLAPLGDLELVFGPRFFADQRGADGPIKVTMNALLATLPAAEADIVNRSSAPLRAQQAGIIAAANLPPPPEVATYSCSLPAAQLEFVRNLMSAANAGDGHNLTAYSVLTALAHFKTFKLIIGTAMSPAIALGMLGSLVQIALKQPSAKVTIENVTNAEAHFTYMGPRLQTMAESNVSPDERYSYAVRELSERRRNESTPRGIAESGTGGARGAASSDAALAAGATGYAQVHTAQLLDILQDRDFISICETIISNLDAHLSPAISIELIFAFRGPGHVILQHALRGHLSFVKNCVAVERIAAELRPHGPQWLANVIAKAVLPPEDSTATLRRLAPEPDHAMWKALCKGELHNFNVENAIWAVIAKTMGYTQFTRIPDADQYSNLDRLRRTERALSALIIVLGYREDGSELCFATLMATIIAYHDDCTALDESTRNQFMRSVIVGVLTESFTREGALLDQRRPGATLPEYFVAPNSLAIDRLQRGRRDGPALQNVSQAFRQLIGDEKARHFGVGQNLVPTGVASAGTKTAVKPDPGALPADGTNLTGTPGGGKKKTAAEKDAARKELSDNLEVGSGVKNCVDLSSRPGYVGMGRDKRTRQFFSIEEFYAAEGVPKPPGGKVPTDLTKLGPDTACPCVWMSKASGIEEVMCTSAGRPGHEKGGKAHQVPDGWRKKMQAVLFAASIASGQSMTLASPTVSARSAPGVTAGGRSVVTGGADVPPPTSTYTNLSLGALAGLEAQACRGSPHAVDVESFEAVGGVAYLPIWFPSPAEPHVLLPDASGARILGSVSPGVASLRGGQAREAALELAAQLTTGLFTLGRRDLVPFGFFTDSARAGGQVAGFVASSPPPPRAEATRYASLEHALADKATGHIWVATRALAARPVGRLALLSAARAVSFVEPMASFELLGAQIGAMPPKYVAPPDDGLPVDCVAHRVSPAQVKERSLAACNALRSEFNRALREDALDSAAQECLASWRDIVEPPPLGELPPGLLNLAAAPADSAVLNCAYPAHTRPVTTAALPRLPPPPPADALPSRATEWRDALCGPAGAVVHVWLHEVRGGFRNMLAGEAGERVAARMPPAIAVGTDNWSEWAAQLAEGGHVIVRRNGRFELLDLSLPPEAFRRGGGMNRAFIAAMLRESGSTDLALRDMLLTHGAVYLSDLRPVLLLQPPLRSFFASSAGFASAHSELGRMASLGWFEVHCCSRLDSGHFELPSLPYRINPSGAVARKLEPDRWRGIQDFGGPRRRLFELPPLAGLNVITALLIAFGRKFVSRLPNQLIQLVASTYGGDLPEPPLSSAPPPTHARAAARARRAQVRSLNVQSGIAESRAARVAHAAERRPATSQLATRHTPALRRHAEPSGIRDDFAAGLADPTTPSATAWAGGRWDWPQELKPLFSDLLVSIVIIGHMAQLCGMEVYVLSDDAKDWFHQFALATLQCWACGMLRLDVDALARGDLDAAISLVYAKCLEMGVSPSSNIAQRALTEIIHSLSERFAATEEPHLRRLEELHPAFRLARNTRRALSEVTGRDEARCHYLTGYTDDMVAVLMGAEATVRYCAAHGAHLGAQGCNVTMAIPAKRTLGVHVPFIGATALTVGMLAYVVPEKVSRTLVTVAAAAEGKLTLADWVKLAGLLNHLVCVLLLPYYVMYGIYSTLDEARELHLGQDVCPTPTADGLKSLRRWQTALTTRSGTTALAAVHASRRPAGYGVVHAMHSDAAKEGTGSPAICGHLYSSIWVLPLREAWRALPIVATEFMGAIINVMVFAPRLHGAPGLLVLDALVVPTVIAGKASSALMRFLHYSLVTLPEYKQVAHTLQVSHEYGPYNPIADAGSRGKGEALESLMKHMGMHADYVDVPPRAVALLDQATAVWLRMSPEERAAHLRLESVGAVEQPNTAATARGTHNLAMDGRPNAHTAAAVGCGGFIGCSTLLSVAMLSAPAAPALEDTFPGASSRYDAATQTGSGDDPASERELPSDHFGPVWTEVDAFGRIECEALRIDGPGGPRYIPRDPGLGPPVVGAEDALAYCEQSNGRMFPPPSLDPPPSAADAWGQLLHDNEWREWTTYLDWDSLAYASGRGRPLSSMRPPDFHGRLIIGSRVRVMSWDGASIYFVRSYALDRDRSSHSYHVELVDRLTHLGRVRDQLWDGEAKVNGVIYLDPADQQPAGGELRQGQWRLELPDPPGHVQPDHHARASGTAGAVRPRVAFSVSQRKEVAFKRQRRRGGAPAGGGGGVSGALGAVVFAAAATSTDARFASPCFEATAAPSPFASAAPLRADGAHPLALASATGLLSTRRAAVQRRAVPSVVAGASCGGLIGCAALLALAAVPGLPQPSATIAVNARSSGVLAASALAGGELADSTAARHERAASVSMAARASAASLHLPERGASTSSVRPDPAAPHQPRPGGGVARAAPLRACGACAGCLQPDCGLCPPCLDKPKFGGLNRLRKRCDHRACVGLERPAAPPLDAAPAAAAPAPRRAVRSAAAAAVAAFQDDLQLLRAGEGVDTRAHEAARRQPPRPRASRTGAEASVAAAAPAAVPAARRDARARGEPTVDYVDGFRFVAFSSRALLAAFRQRLRRREAARAQSPGTEAPIVILDGAAVAGEERVASDAAPQPPPSPPSSPPSSPLPRAGSPWGLPGGAHLPSPSLGLSASLPLWASLFALWSSTFALVADGDEGLDGDNAMAFEVGELAPSPGPSPPPSPPAMRPPTPPVRRRVAPLPHPSAASPPARRLASVHFSVPAVTSVAALPLQLPRSFARSLQLVRARAAPLRLASCGSSATSLDVSRRSDAPARGAPAHAPSREAEALARRDRAGAGLTVGAAAHGVGVDRLQSLLARAYAPSTNAHDAGHWRAWERACAHLGASPWRIDVAANSGADPEGHAEEVYLVCMALILMYSWMRPRSHADPAADPRNAFKKLHAVRRIHRKRWPPVEMVSLTVVATVLKGMLREFVEVHGFRPLVPKRKLPLTNHMADGMLGVYEGATRAGLTVTRASHHWVAMLCLFTVLLETGMRKDEVTGDKGRNGLTFASCSWKVGGVVYPVLTSVLYRGMRPGDGVYLAHGVAKNDPLGIYFAATPSFLAWRAAGRCACRALAEMLLSSGVGPADFAVTPLFGPEPGRFFTGAQVDAAFQLCLVKGAGVPEEQLADYSVHSFRIFLACALLSAGCPRWLIMRLVRWRGEESLEIYARVSDAQWVDRIDSTLTANVDAAQVPRLPTIDLDAERLDQFNVLAHAMLGADFSSALSTA